MSGTSTPTSMMSGGPDGPMDAEGFHCREPLHPFPLSSCGRVYPQHSWLALTGCVRWLNVTVQLSPVNLRAGLVQATMVCWF